MTPRLWTIYVSHRYGFLFFTLLASLAIFPVLQPLGFQGNAVEVLLAANLAAAVLAIGERLLRRVALVALAVALVARPGAALLNEIGLSDGSLLMWAVLALLTAASALRFSLRGKAIGSEQIYAALSAYLLAGFFFGQIYWVIEQFSPGSLAVGGASAPAGLPVYTTIYFSFVTLASLGYGDVLPVSDPARGIAVVEVVSGQLYLAVMVARLVAAWR